MFILAFLSFCIDFPAKTLYYDMVHFNNKMVCSANFHVSVVYFIDKERLFVNESCRKPKRARRVLTFACCLSLLLSSVAPFAAAAGGSSGASSSATASATSGTSSGDTESYTTELYMDYIQRMEKNTSPPPIP